jgi:hypothetical protein
MSRKKIPEFGSVRKVLHGKSHCSHVAHGVGDASGPAKSAGPPAAPQAFSVWWPLSRHYFESAAVRGFPCGVSLRRILLTLIVRESVGPSHLGVQNSQTISGYNMWSSQIPEC